MGGSAIIQTQTGQIFIVGLAPMIGVPFIETIRRKSKIANGGLFSTIKNKNIDSEIGEGNFKSVIDVI